MKRTFKIMYNNLGLVWSVLDLIMSAHRRRLTIEINDKKIDETEKF